MTLTSNTPITQENVALLKAGDWLMHELGHLGQFIEAGEYVSFRCLDGELFPDSTESFTYIGPDLGDGWIGWGGGPNPYGTKLFEVRHRSGIECLCEADAFEALGWEWSESDPHATDILAFRPALAKPAEGVIEAGTPPMTPELSAAMEECMAATYPEAKPAEGSGQRIIDGLKDVLAGDVLVRDPTPPSVDWERVGPKLVEALEAIKAGGSWQGDTASDALAPTQPQSNGDDR